MPSTYLTRTATANNNSVGKWTFSCWVKRSSIATDQNIISFYSTSNYRSALRFESDNKIRFYEFYNGSSIVTKLTNRLFRDTNAWYHIVLAVDKTVSSPDTQIYINGEAITSWATNDDYSQNENGKFNDAEPIYIGTENGTGGYFDGLMSHVHFVDGTAYTASTFGETDSVTGEWKIIAEPSGINYGTNGFFILKDGNSVTDQSGNSNNFTVGGGTLTNTEDNPSNVFATLNPLDLGDLTNIATLSNGNTYYSSTQGGYNMMVTTLGANSGKWYWEAKYISHNMHGFSDNFGINPGFTGDRIPIGTNTSYLGKTANSYAFVDSGGVYNNDVTSTYASGATAANNLNDVVGIALDLDNNKAYYHVNGTYWNSANPSSGTGGLSINPASQTETGFYFPSISDKSSNRSYVYAFNFGNGYFGTTAVTSNSGNGYSAAGSLGIFQYQPPTGYTALCTKGLNQ